MRESSRIVKNIAFGFGSKLTTLAIGLIIPRLFIVSFGSEINGLITTVTQIFTYLALLEAGIGNSAVNALYGPLTTGNYEEANYVLTQARHYYRKVTVVYAIAVGIFALGYPALVDTNVSYLTIFLIIIFQGIANCTSYYFCAVYNQLLMADGKKYVTENVRFVVHIVVAIAKIVLIYLGADILVVQGVYLLLSLVCIPITIIYCKRKYKFLDFNKESSENFLYERGAFIVHEISGAVFANTDVFIISVFCSFSLASVYAIYNLVFSSLNSMIGIANAGLGFLLGENINGDHDKIVRIYDAYSLLYAITVFSFMTVAMIMVAPFVKLYTAGVSDVNYSLTLLPELFTIVALLSGIRSVAVKLINVSRHADKTKNQSIAEMIINLTASILLVNIVGMQGVLLGTIIALIYRSNDIIIYANKRILKRSPWKEYKTVLYLSVIFVIFYIISRIFPITCMNYTQWIVSAAIVMLVVTSSYVVASIILDKEKYKIFFEVIKKWFNKPNKN